MQNRWSLETMQISKSLLLLIAAGFFTLGCATNDSKDLDNVLSKAGDNRWELMKVLSHYEAEGDEQKLAAGSIPDRKHGRARIHRHAPLR